MNGPRFDLSIVCPSPKRGISERPAHGTLMEDDGKLTTFRLDETKRDFNQYRFPIQPGYLIFSPVAVYVCDEVSYMKHRPKQIMLKTRLLKKLAA